MSRILREYFTFVCFGVDTAEERLALESGLIALFAQHPLGHSSESWLGRHAASEIIRRTGLWNTQRVDAEPLNAVQLRRLEQLVKAMPENRRYSP